MPTPHLACPTCDGIGYQFRKIYTPLYGGYVQEAHKCSACKGARVLTPKPVSVVKRILSRLGVSA